MALMSRCAFSSIDVGTNFVYIYIFVLFISIT